MDILSAKYTVSGTIEVSLMGGGILFVPDDMGNRDRRGLAKWEAAGGTIASYVAPAPTPRRTGTPREFMALFSHQEQLAIFSAAQQSVEINVWIVTAMAGEFSLDHPSVAPGLGALVSVGIISQGRADEIAATDFDA